ncbi:DUF4930 family protein [Mammaliicoccus stepanovicii]|uniref:DUF4930 domain-containing protein n=1 Tax=Mammaliicoccus stepanovicii TaxID=643214 RepID=A0A239Z1Q8_9STAP|nr:DUF4930 family protein [Mammaliicoccus stepanovicii]PNZ72379.1 DUF4930 domain-containing protein [Mammaliicoccus stepanovicii]GGI40237.1 DUF4930 domain-containing protein [Mammaliicoccus stepanovicii]SNV65269.1 Uncharacterised protein [Mammaliicoccus stepanovicii]
MRWLFRLIRNLLALLAIIIIIVIVYKSVPELSGLNPFNNDDQQTQQISPKRAHSTYTVEDNALLQNVPLGQTKQAFRWINKREFMDVSGMERMGYNDDYIAGQRGTEYILYKFGEPQMYVYQTEQDLIDDLNELNADIKLAPKDSY